MVFPEYVRLTRKARAANVEEEICADARHGNDRSNQDVDQRKAKLGVCVAGFGSDDGSVLEATHGIQAAEVKEIRERTARIPCEYARCKQRTRGDRKVLA